MVPLSPAAHGASELPGSEPGRSEDLSDDQAIAGVRGGNPLWKKQEQEIQR